MLQWQVPYRERLELSIASSNAALVLVVELRETSCHFAAAWARSRDNNQWATGDHIVVLTKTLITCNQFHVVGIAIDGVVDTRR